MQYILTEEQKFHLEETYRLLSEVEVKGPKNLSALFGSLVRIENILKNVVEYEEPRKQE